MSVVGPTLPPGTERVLLPAPRGPVAAALLEPRGEPRGTVLLVPGFTGSKEDFSPVLGAVAADGWCAVAIDQRGQYETAGSDDPADYAVEDLAQDLLAVAGALPRPVPGPLHLVGHSFGGLVARAAVLHDPARWASLVLMSSGPSALTGIRVTAMAALRPLVEAGDLRAVLEVMDAAAELDPRRAAVSEELRDFLRRRFLASSVAGMLGMADALTSEPDRVDELRASGVPLLVLHGDGDDAWLPAVQEEMATRLGARHCVVPGALHSPAAEQPGATVAALVEFWASVTPRE